MSSQEQRPIRSRRELRRAREQQAQASAAAVGTPDGGSAEPAEAPAGDKQVPVKAKPTQSQPNPAKQEQPAQAAQPKRPAGTPRNRRAADAPVDAVSPATAERSSQIRARDRAALRAIKELADKEEQLSGGGPPTRRQLRLQQLQAELATSANPIVPAADSKPSGVAKEDVKGMVAPGTKPRPEPAKPAQGMSSPDNSRADGGQTSPAEADMSVEQALAVRGLIAAQVQNQTAKLEHIAEHDPLAVDPEVLAQQIALAERAAVLNKRAAAKQKLAEQARPEKPSGVESGPSTANNLAMVTPLEFVKVPGVERPVMKRPSTTFVPLVTSPHPNADTKQGPNAKQGPNRSPRGRAGVLARAEAVARNARKRTVVVEPGQEAERAPVSASTAYGLDPLDAGTAGLARAQRNRLLQYGVLAAGFVALIVGIIMITSG
jgi:hypothetical protein